MERIIIKEDMINLLKSVINKKFISYEREFRSYVKEEESFGNIRLNFDNKSIEIEFMLEGRDFFGDLEDLIVILCKEVDLNSKFVPYLLNVDSKEIDIGEKVKEIKIIRDNISIKTKEAKYEYEYDQAIQFILEKSSYMFYNNCFFMEIINIAKDKNLDEVYPIKKVIDFWKDEDGENIVEVKREEIIL